MSHLLQKTRLPLLSVLLLGTASPLALAAPLPDEATAAQLSEKIQAGLQTMIAPIAGPGAKLDFVGQTKVTAQGEVYLVEIPAMHATLKDAVADIPAMTGTLTPTDGPGYAFTLNLPAPLLTFSDATEALTLQAATRSFTGVWQPGLGSLPEAHIEMGTVSLTNKQNETLMSLTAAKFDNASRIDTANKMSGSASGYVVGLSVFEEKTHNQLVKLDRLDMASQNSNVDADAIKALQEQLQKLNQQESASAPQSLMQMASSLQSVMGDGQGHIKVTNATFSYYDANKVPTSWSLPTAMMDFESGHNADGTSRLSFSYGHDKLTVTPALTGVMADVLPSKAGFGFTFDKMPLRELAQAIATNVPPAPPPAPALVDGKPAPAPHPTLLSEATHQQITALLNQYKPTFSIDKILFGSRALQSLTTGLFTANTEAKLHMTGTSDTRIAGLDAFTARLGEMTSPPANSTTPQPQADPEAQGLLMMLSMLQGMGQQAEGGLRTYHFEVGADGSAKLNGTDVASLLGMGMGMNVQDNTHETAPAQSTPRRHK